MSNSIATICNRSITILFYLLFFFVPLFFVGDTFELFEFNKLWLTFGITILIGIFWLGKMIAERRFFIKRTPLDIPILLFLLSQLIATVHSLDVHTSIWGYYSRFNGSLLSLITYIFLYYAFVSNQTRKQVFGALYSSIFGGIVVALWGLPSHFGHDPTCFMFRGTFDVSCWTDAFHPTIRMFSTMGQPDWLAAYLAFLLPVSLALLLLNRGLPYLSDKKTRAVSFFAKQNVFFALLVLTVLLFYFDLVWTQSKSGIIGFWIGALLFAAGAWYLLKRIKRLPRLPLVATLLGGLIIFTFLIGTPFSPKTDTFTFPSLITSLTKQPVPEHSVKPNQQQAVATGELGGTDSGKIRLYVWQGALDIWRHNPLFGTGVETFAFAYYQYKPLGHNLTSEWDYLYNKAHNEYLNYLATTGAFGLGTYLLVIGWFLWTCIKILFAKQKEETTHTFNSTVLTLGLLAGFITILITNFFGFSVVIMNVYLFLIPAFVFLLTNALATYPELSFQRTVSKKEHTRFNLFQWTGLLLVATLGLWMLITLIRFWNADRAYALGYNLDRVNRAQEAFQPLHNAIKIRPGEPTFQDELTANDALLTQAYAYEKMATQAGELANEAITVSDNLVAKHPNNIVFWKTRIRVFYILAQLDPKYLQISLDAAKKANQLAPTDPKILYNLGLLYNQAGKLDKAVTAMQQTIKLKPNYPDPYIALGIFYHQQALGKDNKTVVDSAKQQQAVSTLQYYIKNLSPNDKSAINLLKSWQK